MNGPAMDAFSDLQYRETVCTGLNMDTTQIELAPDI
jgi:hypothetical protein